MFKRIAVLSALSLLSVTGLAQSQEIRGTVADCNCGKQHMIRNAIAPVHGTTIDAKQIKPAE